MGEWHDRRAPAAPKLSAAERVELVASCEAAVWKVAATVKRKNPYCDIDDLASEARLALWLAALRFDPAFGFTFLTYAYRGMVRRARRFADRQAANGVHVPQYLGRIGFPVVRLSREDRRKGGTHSGEPPDYRRTPPRFPADFWALPCLTERQRAAVVGRYRDGLSDGEIGRQLGVTGQCVNAAAAQALQKLRLYGDRAAMEGL